MAGYEEIVPGSAKRILDWAEVEQQERHRMQQEQQRAQQRQDALELETLRATTRKDWAGWASGSVLTAGILFASFHLLNVGRDLGGIVGIVAVTTTLAVAFLRSQRRAAKP